MKISDTNQSNFINFMHGLGKVGSTERNNTADQSKKHQSSGPHELDSSTTKPKLYDMNFEHIINNYKDVDFINNYKDEAQRDVESLTLRNIDSSAIVLPMAISVIFRGDGSF